MPVRCAGFGQLPALNVTPTTFAMARRASADTRQWSSPPYRISALPSISDSWSAVGPFLPS